MGTRRLEDNKINLENFTSKLGKKRKVLSEVLVENEITNMLSEENSNSVDEYSRMMSNLNSSFGRKNNSRMFPQSKKRKSENLCLYRNMVVEMEAYEWVRTDQYQPLKPPNGNQKRQISSWHQFPAEPVPENIVQIMYQAASDEKQPQNISTVHSSFAISFGGTTSEDQSNVHLNKVMNDGIFTNNQSSQMKMSDFLFNQRVSWSQALKSSFNLLKDSINTDEDKIAKQFYLVSEKQLIYFGDHPSTKALIVIISQSNLSLRKGMSNYGIKYEAPFEKSLEAPSKERKTKTETGEEMPQLKRPSSLLDGHEKSLIVINEPLHVCLFYNFLLNRITRRDGWHGLPTIVSKHQFNSSTETVPTIKRSSNGKLHIQGYFFENDIEGIVNFLKEKRPSTSSHPITVSFKRDPNAKFFQNAIGIAETGAIKNINIR